ncbi:MAG TPA: CRISPR-associated endonuclease Cas2 [Alphaproteobacteria bacterium]|nr:CRISPR-associated endonuclease Cas2 [Alphaproteobacteria bacterium]
MYAIVVYDVGEQRVAKVCKYLRTVLQWMQNSVFEGKLTEAQIERMKRRLATLIDPEEDAILIYLLSDEKWLKRETMGIEKNFRSNLL